jgi:hypothetical protein
MRVKLSYSVDIEELIEEVSELFGYVADKSVKVDNQIETIRDLLFEERPEGAHALMQKMRIALGEMDARLADLSLILEGYMQFKKQQAGGTNDSSDGRPTLGTTDGNAVQGTEQSDGSEVE